MQCFHRRDRNLHLNKKDLIFKANKKNLNITVELNSENIIRAYRLFKHLVSDESNNIVCLT
jgi:hypothetical protein